MDISFSAFAALLGAAIGGLTSGLASWVTHRIQVRTQWLAQDTLRRQDLYKEFVDAAAECYVDALQHEQPGIPARVELRAKIGRIRRLSSPRVVALADQVGQKIMSHGRRGRPLKRPQPVRTPRAGSAISKISMRKSRTIVRALTQTDFLCSETDT